MEEIYEPNSKFNFEHLTLSPPTSILGGNYFIKFQVSGNPLYIQSPKCCTKQGIVKAGKKMYCDLLMSNDHEQFIQWMENLENYSQEYIFKNREKWFETDLEKHDIENSFSSPVKTYKSGKFYTTRTNIPIRLGKSSLKIYDENENDVNIDLIKDTTNIIAIMEVQGIKCSARSFQIEIELKQMMVLKPSNLFEKCIIKSSNLSIDNPILPSILDVHLDENITYNLTPTNEINKIGGVSEINHINDSVEYDQHDDQDDDSDNVFAHKNTTVSVTTPTVSVTTPTVSVTTPTTIPSNSNKSDLTEVEFTLDELPENEVIQIKTRNDVYYQMYKEAKKKAKLAKDLALSTYLDAKRIKNTYMLTDIDDDDSDSDLESNLTNNNHFVDNLEDSDLEKSNT